MLLSEMSWAEIREFLAVDDRIILPLGAVEEHGPHLGLGTDSIEAEALARRIGSKAEVLVAPTLNYGMSLQQMAFPGTITLKPTTLIAVLQDILHSLFRHGFRRVLIVNGHGGNSPSINSAVQTVCAELNGLRVKSFEWWTDPGVCSIVEEMCGRQEGSHASFAETAFMLAVAPRAVKLERLTGRNAPVTPSREISTLGNFASLYPDGIMGLDPSNASSSAGDAILSKSIEVGAREIDNWSI